MLLSFRACGNLNSRIWIGGFNHLSFPRGYGLGLGWNHQWQIAQQTVGDDGIQWMFKPFFACFTVSPPTKWCMLPTQTLGQLGISQRTTGFHHRMNNYLNNLWIYTQSSLDWRFWLNPWSLDRHIRTIYGEPTQAWIWLRTSSGRCGSDRCPGLSSATFWRIKQWLQNCLKFADWMM
jgi:hypothetical protein